MGMTTSLNEEEIRAKLLEDMKIGLQEVIDGKSKEWKSPFLCGNDVSEFLKELGFDTRVSNIETNGWQGDYWLTVKAPDGETLFGISGSAWYGGVEFYSDVEEEDL